MCSTSAVLRPSRPRLVCTEASVLASSETATDSSSGAGCEMERSGTPVSNPELVCRLRPGGTLDHPRGLSRSTSAHVPSPPEVFSGRSSRGRPTVARSTSPPTRPWRAGGGGSTLSSNEAYDAPAEVRARTVYHVVTLFVLEVGEPTSAADEPGSDELG
eukprot:scaffold2654_cov76-Phaeocystis_antarctica.AAC.2